MEWVKSSIKKDKSAKTDEKLKYSNEVYDKMYDYYEDCLNDKNDRQELIETVDSIEPHELFKRLCNWLGTNASTVEFVYESIYGKGQRKGELSWYKK